MTGLFVTRLATTDDLRFVAASWFLSFWKGTMQRAGAAYEQYRPAQDALINTLLQRSRVVVVAAESVPDEIVGYAVLEKHYAHYVYVKSAYRRMGVAKGLLRSGTTRYTHSTRAGNRVARALGITFDPYQLLGPTSPERT